MIHPKSVVMIECETFDQAKRWYDAEYAATILLRRQAADSCLILVDGVAKSPA